MGAGRGSQRGNDPALAAATVEALNAQMGGARLAKVMTALARPTRLMRGKEGAGTAADLNVELMGAEEKALFEAYTVAAGKLTDSTTLPEFLAVIEALADPVQFPFRPLTPP